MNLINFPIVDPHIHQWDPYHTPHTAALLVKLLGQHPALMDKVVRLVKPQPLIDMLGLTDYALAPYLPANYAADLGDNGLAGDQQSGYQVEQVVHIEASWHDHKGNGVVGETRWVKQLPFEQHGIRLGGIVATADFTDRRFKKILQLHQAQTPLLRGLRRMASHHPDPGVHQWSDEAHLYTSRKFLAGFEQFAKNGLSFDAWVYSTQIADVTQLASTFPETPMVLDHLGTPVGLFGPVGNYTGVTDAARQDIFARWQDDIAQLAEQPNVYAKISGLMMPVLGHAFYKNRQLASASQMVDLLSPLIENAIAVFGTQRIIYASNFPMDKVNTSLSNLMEAYARMIQPYGDAAMQAIFRDNAKRFYRLD
ncbi:amidohydrolase family protein [Alkanindiges illinoisensis]|uniref:amidohydrolase family protein n=1 Tax=Alkanindiges illinoisensis TaxID=197183 RepID=UPI00047A018D|nr:amidohydrolase family protein [Alkanindiges illinoisensis]